jgi:hypothetical protein
LLARDLVARRLIESPEVRWTAPAGGKALRWLEVSGRLMLPRTNADTPGDRMNRR